ncbi:hypothetical protein ACJJI3_01690 [Microbulbifer sp. ZKSA004]|uniref:hypothetical protein n=1 Tax=Microbulbifer sp. ZKSA004 TaxID=3243389 RepID=UPI00403A532F
MAKYIYLPVNSEEMLEFAENMASAWSIPKNHILANKVTSGIGKSMYRWIDKCLSSLKSGDTLYIVSHGTGAGDGEQIGAQRNNGKNKQTKVFERGVESWQGGEWKTYTPTQLAATLVKEGLPGSFVDLHLCACGSGYDGERLRPWAQRLREAMATTHTSLEVTGYLGWFDATGSSVKIKVNTKYYDLNERAVTFS